jgi:hypothetical protein
MADSAILLVDDEQDSCTSLSDLIGDLDYPGSGASDGPAPWEQSRPYTSGLTLLEYRSPGTDGVELDSRLRFGRGCTGRCCRSRSGGDGGSTWANCPCGPCCCGCNTMPRSGWVCMRNSRHNTRPRAKLCSAMSNTRTGIY